MRGSLEVILVVLVSITVMLSAQSPGEQSLRAAMENFCEAANRGDGDYIDQHYLSEVSRFHSDGKLDLGWDEKKAEAFKRALDGGFSLSFELCEVVDARIYGNVGLIAGYIHGQINFGDGGSMNGPWRATYVWVWSDGQWKEAHHHVSLLEE